MFTPAQLVEYRGMRRGGSGKRSQRMEKEEEEGGGGGGGRREEGISREGRGRREGLLSLFFCVFV